MPITVIPMGATTRINAITAIAFHNVLSNLEPCQRARVHANCFRTAPAAAAGAADRPQLRTSGYPANAPTSRAEALGATWR
jgi:hypothetical protein